MTTKNTRNILKIKGYKAIRWHSLRAHHLKSLIFQAFRKKTPVKRKGSFNFSKSNKINNLQKQDIPKTTIIADTLKKCDAKCDAFWKNSQLFLPKFHIWLRKNVFYMIVELPRVEGKRRYKRISLHTNDYIMNLK